MTTRLEAKLVPVAAISADQREAMFHLLDRYYENVTPAGFLAGLAEKQWAILLRDPTHDALCGFSTQMLLEVPLGKTTVRALFSGDTVIDRPYWGDILLARTWGRLALSLIDRHGAEGLYWFLISKGYKTYRFLPLFFHEFYPRYDVPTPEWAGGVLDALAAHRYPHGYDAAAGVVRAGVEKDRLRAGVAELTAARLRDPHVRYFARRNPQHARGDELCCLAPLSRANFTAAAYRVIGPAPLTAEI
jgi:hypothetical protein